VRRKNGVVARLKRGRKRGLARLFGRLDNNRTTFRFSLSQTGNNERHILNKRVPESHPPFSKLDKMLQASTI